MSKRPINPIRHRRIRLMCYLQPFTEPITSHETALAAIRDYQKQTGHEKLVHPGHDDPTNRQSVPSKYHDRLCIADTLVTKT